MASVLCKDKLFTLIIASVAGISLQTSCKTVIEKSGRSFYFSQKGDDKSEGSSEHPFKTLNRLKEINLEKGDNIFLEAGAVFNGSILIDSIDAKVNDVAITVQSYGKGTATIFSGDSAGIEIRNCGHILLKNLNVSGSGRKDGNLTSGVIINESHDVLVDSLLIRGYQKSGLSISTSKNIVIDHVIAKENGYAGISANGLNKRTDNKNISIKNCLAENNPGDPTNFSNHSGNGIVIGYSTSVLIEYCTATNNGWDMPRTGNGPVGIWAFESDSVTVQHCLSFKNKTAKGASDGGGFDFDGGITNSIIQYCLSYENEGSGYGLFQYAGASNWYNNVIRFNLSVNDGIKTDSARGILVWNSSDDSLALTRCEIYNNTVYNDHSAAIGYLKQAAHNQFLFANNIFVGKDKLIDGDYTGSFFAGNNWFSRNAGFSIGKFHSLQAWRAGTDHEIINGNPVGSNQNLLFNSGDINRIQSANDLNSLSGIIIQSSDQEYQAVDLEKIFGIHNGKKDFKGAKANSTLLGSFAH